MNKPLYEHDCDCCIFLGSHKENDLYYHKGERPTVIARYSNYAPDYVSGMCFATKGKNNSVPVLYEAKERAFDTSSVLSILIKEIKLEYRGQGR